MDELARIELGDDGRGRVVRLSGEIDISNADGVERRLRELAQDAPFVLDMSGLAYLDSSGVRLLFRLAETMPGELRLIVGAASPARRVLQVAGAERLLSLEEPAEASVEAPTRRDAEALERQAEPSRAEEADPLAALPPAAERGT